jgi:hypothetical protein
MASYWIYEPANAAAGSFEAASRAVIVRDGWSWGALLLGPIWTLWRGLWLMFLVWLALIAGQLVIDQMWPQLAVLAAVLMTLFSVWFALEGNALRSSSLARKGYRVAGIAVARSLAEAERTYMDSLGLSDRDTSATANAPAAAIFNRVPVPAPEAPEADAPASVPAAPVPEVAPPPPVSEPPPVAARPGAVHTIAPVARAWPLARARDEERSPMPPSPVRAPRSTRVVDTPAPSETPSPPRGASLPRATSPFDNLTPPPRKPEGGGS